MKTSLTYFEISNAVGMILFFVFIFLSSLNLFRKLSFFFPIGKRILSLFEEEERINGPRAQQEAPPKNQLDKKNKSQKTAGTHNQTTPFYTPNHKSQTNKNKTPPAIKQKTTKTPLRTNQTPSQIHGQHKMIRTEPKPQPA